MGFLCFEKGERKIRVADKRVKRLTLGSHVASPSSMSFRVSASSSVKPEKDIRIGLLGASGYTGAEVCAMSVSVCLKFNSLGIYCFRDLFGFEMNQSLSGMHLAAILWLVGYCPP